MCLSEDVGEAATQGSLAVGRAQPSCGRGTACASPVWMAFLLRLQPPPHHPCRVQPHDKLLTGDKRSPETRAQCNSAIVFPKMEPQAARDQLADASRPGRHKTGFPVVTPCSAKGLEGTRTHQKSLLALTHQSMVPQTSSRPSQSTSVPLPHIPLDCHPRGAPPRCPLL